MRYRNNMPIKREKISALADNYATIHKIENPCYSSETLNFENERIDIVDMNDLTT